MPKCALQPRAPERLETMIVGFYESSLSHQVIIQLNLEHFYPSPNLSSADKYASKNLAVHSYSQCITQTAEDVREVMKAACKKTTKSLDSLSHTLAVQHSPPCFFIAGTHWPITGWIWASLCSTHLSLTQGEQHLLQVEPCKLCSLRRTESATDSQTLRHN